MSKVKTYKPMIIQMPQEHVESAMLCHLVPLRRLLKRGCATKITQDIDRSVSVKIVHWEYVPKLGRECWVHVWSEKVRLRTINTYADIECEFFRLWESIPAEFKREEEGGADE